MTQAQVRYTAADAADISPTDLVVTPNPRNPREVTLSSALGGLAGLAVGGVIVITAAGDDENRGVYVVTRETTANEEYTAKKQGAGRNPVTGASAAATIQRRSFAKQIDADGLSLIHSGTGILFNV